MSSDPFAKARIEAQLVHRARLAHRVTPVLHGEVERAALAEMKAASARPFGCGPEIVGVAPARGTVERFSPR